MTQKNAQGIFRKKEEREITQLQQKIHKWGKNESNEIYGVI